MGQVARTAPPVSQSAAGTDWRPALTSSTWTVDLGVEMSICDLIERGIDRGNIAVGHPIVESLVVAAEQSLGVRFDSEYRELVLHFGRVLIRNSIEAIGLGPYPEA
jgi:hypothetical protein